MNHLRKILEKFREVKIVVIGDIILDKYIVGKVSRISPEAPVPVLKSEREEYALGGAAYVAECAANLGASVSLYGFLGNDKEASVLTDLAKSKGIKLNTSVSKITPLKTRLVGNGQQIARIDREETDEKFFKGEIRNSLEKDAESADIILVSDYAKGTITKDLFSLIDANYEKIVVDPKPANKDIYTKMRLITPNENEAMIMSSCNDYKKAGRALKEKFKCDVIVTLGSKGLAIFSEHETEVPTAAQEVYDVTGAGDAFIATLGVALATGASLEEASILANHSAGIAVSKHGTYAPNLNELNSALKGVSRKIVSLNELKAISSTLKRGGKKLVWTNGCFDIIHSGHITYLRNARKQGDVLLVGINSDESVRKLKGPQRPILAQEERAEIIAALEFVDYVLIFSETTAEKCISELKPDVYVKGGDYTTETINQEEKKLVESYGGRVEIVRGVEGKSSSKVLERILPKK
ncbi:D-glycero-beta-D-manno-heptose 1-phosphate adenylyltransferase [Candidatus Pacearchaeota archaeon]|nr:MAG: D-glycero-beta-D-manno-heptose 1-phosphate adenylyltransferase [Candidatus Pacearchaeota archaeon]